MKHKVAELEGALLDLAVMQVEGRPWAGVPAYSTLWELAGPIIEREEICLVRVGWQEKDTAYWQAGFELQVDRGSQCPSGWLDLPAIDLEHEQTGQTPLIAAMRAYVAAKLGEEVEL